MYIIMMYMYLDYILQYALPTFMTQLLWPCPAWEYFRNHFTLIQISSLLHMNRIYGCPGTQLMFLHHVYQDLSEWWILSEPLGINYSVGEKLSRFIRHLSDGLYIFHRNLWNLPSDIWAQPSEMSDVSDVFRLRCNYALICSNGSS